MRIPFLQWQSLWTVLLVGSFVGPAHAQKPPIDISGLGQGRCSKMQMLLEKTVFQLDVLRVSIRFGPKTTRQLRHIASGKAYSKQLAHRVAQTAYRAERAYVKLRFERDVSLDQFVSAIRENLRRAKQAGMISASNYREVSANLPVWFAFLDERGIREDDWLLYRVRPESLRTVFVDNEGNERLDQIDRGEEPRLALLSGYFAPGSDFREGLVRSLCQ